MNEKERDFSTMDLEDIVKEFGGGKYPPVSDKMVDTAELLELSAVLSGANVEISPRIPEPAPEETPEQPLPEVPAAPEESAVPEVQEQTPAPVTEDTVRLEAIRDAQVREEAPQVEESTVRLEKLPEHLTAEETPEPEETSAPEPVPEDTKEEQAEYYDDEDEDEVELPELPPLIFKPKSKLQQLRSALVAGPERRFYELSGIGVGKVQLAILASILLILLSGTTAVMYVAGMIAEKRLKLMIFGQILAMLVSGLLGSQQMIEGICDLSGVGLP